MRGSVAVVVVVMMALVAFGVALDRHCLLVDDSRREFWVRDGMTQTLVDGDRPEARSEAAAAAAGGGRGGGGGRTEKAGIRTSNCRTNRRESAFK